MAINFTRPYLLILLPITLFLVFYTSKRLSRIYKVKKNTILIVRSIIFILLILALSGFSFKWNAKDAATVFVIDASDSMLANKSAVEKFVADAINKKTSKDAVAVLSFGDNALIESFVSKSPAFNGLETKVNGTYTNIENALTTAISLMPENSKKRIVLITDSEENEGKASKAAPSIVEQGIDLKVYKIDKAMGDEAAVDSINIPKRLNIGEDFNVVVNITSTVATKGKLTLFSGKDKVSEESVQLLKGSNSFVFKDRALNGGFKNYRVLLEPEADSEVKNNEASAFTNVKDKPKILVIEDAKGEAEELINILNASGIEYNKIDADSAPRTLQELTSYNSIITCNVSAENLNEGFLNSLEPYVKDFGGGFVATGGENSFALGGYFQTNLEKVLPVNMEMKGKKEIPEMSMMLIIDKSGSMTGGSGGITKLDVAKEAAARTLDSLRIKDEIGVLTFDDTNYWVVKPKKAEDKESIRDDIGTIRPGGGTSILPALEEGYKSLKTSNAKIKHIILLTDGQAEQSGYDELVKRIKKDNITVSTVAVGQDADKFLLESIAKGADGRFYATDDISNIPTIFAKETFMAAKAYLNNREFTPVISSSHPIIAAAENGLPSLLGYIGASPKDAAKVILRSDEDDPILTIWQYGLGKTAAWNSDINGKWSRNYVGWNNNVRLWQNIINYSISNYESEEASIEAELQGSKGIISFTDKNFKEETNTTAIVVTPSLESIEVKLYPTEPGKYGGSFDVKEPGVYMIKGVQNKSGEILNTATNGLAVQYSPEYRVYNENSSLDMLVNDSGGSYIKTPEEVFKGELKDVSGRTDMTTPFIIIALLFLIFDIALRRLNLSFEKVDSKINIVKENVYSKVKGRKKNFKTLTRVKTKADANKITDLEKISHDSEKSQTNIIEEKPNIQEKLKNNTIDTSELLRRKKNRYK
nr:VWA domain-containing protein [Clostridium caldaquaticum]